MKKLLCPSMMCADYGNLAHEIVELEAAGIDIFHIDIMDGRFVPNFGMGLQDTEYIVKHANKPTDVHLMIKEPGNYVEKFISMGISIIYIHPEAEYQPVRTLQKIYEKGVSPGIALNPGTAIESIKPLLNLTEYVLVMTVNPGFAGQKRLPFVDHKIEKLARIKSKNKFQLMIDGSCSPDVINRWGEMGADGFILGTSGLFGKNRPYREIIKELRC